MDTLTLATRVSRIIDRDMTSGRTQRNLRGMLRAMFPGSEPGSGRAWDLDARQVRVVEDCFRRLRAYEDGSD